MNATLLAQLLVNGLLLGGVYALMSLGINLVWGVMDVINLAHGDLIVVGSFLTFWLFSRLNVNPFISLPVAMAIGFAAGLTVQRFLLARLPKQEGAGKNTLLMTFGVSYVVINISILIWGNEFQTIDYLAGSWNIAGVGLSKARTVAALTACLITTLVWLVLQRTEVGRAVRAVSQNPEGASVCGIDISRVKAFTFGFGTSLAAAAGVLLVLIFPTQSGLGPAYTTRAFAVTAIGGLGSFPGALLGASILGLAEVVTGYFNAQVQSGIAFVLFLIVLLVKPSGLLGGKGV